MSTIHIISMTYRVNRDGGETHFVFGYAPDIEAASAFRFTLESRRTVLFNYTKALNEWTLHFQSRTAAMRKQMFQTDPYRPAVPTRRSPSTPAEIAKYNDEQLAWDHYEANIKAIRNGTIAEHNAQYEALAEAETIAKYGTKPTLVPSPLDAHFKNHLEDISGWLDMIYFDDEEIQAITP